MNLELLHFCRFIVAESFLLTFLLSLQILLCFILVLTKFPVFFGSVAFVSLSVTGYVLVAVARVRCRSSKKNFRSMPAILRKLFRFVGTVFPIQLLIIVNHSRGVPGC